MCLAIPGKIASISGDDPLMRTGKVDFGGILKEVSLAFVPEATVGDSSSSMSASPSAAWTRPRRSKSSPIFARCRN